jgi:hypothetical protein
MSRPHIRPQALSRVEALPWNFLGLDPSRVAAASERTVDMAQLHDARSRINRNAIAASIIMNAYSGFEATEYVRHIQRGASVAQLLVEAGATSEVQGAALVDLATLDDRPAHQTDFLSVNDALVHARAGVVMASTWRLSAEDATANEETLAMLSGGILARAGLAGHIARAVHHMTGPGLEEPTRLREATYGAALLALGTALSTA